MASTDIFVGGEDSGVRQVKVSPVVLFNVADHFQRRTDNKRRVIGTLLGRVNANGTVEVTNCFPLPHSEKVKEFKEVAVDNIYNETMHNLHRRLNTTEEPVGWYATGTETDISSVVIHEFYARECRNPVHLLVDAGLVSGRFDVNAFVSTAYQINDRALSSELRPIPVCMKPGKAEKVGLDVLFKNRRREEGDKSLPSMASEIENLERSMERLLELLDVVGKNVDAVVAGEVEGNVTTGRFLAETLTMVPRMNAADFEQLFGDNMRDLLMVAYLCKLTQTQLIVAEKLLAIDTTPKH